MFAKSISRRSESKTQERLFAGDWNVYVDTPALQVRLASKRFYKSLVAHEALFVAGWKSNSIGEQ